MFFPISNLGLIQLSFIGNRSAACIFSTLNSDKNQETGLNQSYFFQAFLVLKQKMSGDVFF